MDSLIFDMDGTLWDNVDSYVIVWNKALEKTGHKNRVTRYDLLGLMGKEARVMLDVIIPDTTIEEQDHLFDEVIAEYQKLQGSMTPIVYDGVYEGLERLAKRYKLFMLSNCEEGGLINFMNHTRTTHLFEDYMEHGMNLQPKHHNLRLLIEKHGLKSTVYVGDTDSDAVQSAIAGVPFVFVTYGFGDTDKYTLKFDSFPELTNYFLDSKIQDSKIQSSGL
ncbi:MAG: HAD family hydrolase [Dysgonamonadaceae bacterium]|jgi:phosphoglycolate phosphatase|nr:HAD family hydrolase [Dysgonamonadaceae bacterium]